MTARREEGYYENIRLYAYICFLVRVKDYRTMTVAMTRVTVFQETRLRAGFKTGDFVKEKFGGATP